MGFLLDLFGGSKLALILGVVVLLLGGALALSFHEIQTLNRNIGTLEASVEVQKTTIEGLNAATAVQAQQINTLNKKNSKAEKDLSDARANNKKLGDQIRNEAAKNRKGVEDAVNARMQQIWNSFSPPSEEPK